MAKFRQFVKRTGRKAWKAVKKITGDRYGRGWKQISTKGIPQMVKDVQYLKSILNSEKQRYVISPGTSTTGLGQINGNATGYITADVTPIPTQGDGYNNRQGASIKLHSSNFRFMFTEQGSTLSNLKFKVQIFRVLGKPTTAAAAVLDIFNVNPFTGIVDYNSSRNPDTFKDYKLLKTAYSSIPMDPASLVGQQAVKELRFGMRYRNNHIRFDKNTTTVTDGQLIMVIFCNAGNVGALPTLAPWNGASIPVQAAGSGALENHYIEHYYYDN